MQAVAEAFRHDRKILVEEFVRGREIECGVLEGEDGTLIASAPGEIVPSNRHEFYTYEAKYLDEHGALVRSRPTCRATSATRCASSRSKLSARSAAKAWRASTFPARGRQAPRQRGQHAAGLHQHQHVPQGDGGERDRLCRAGRPPHSPRARARWLRAGSFRRSSPLTACGERARVSLTLTLSPARSHANRANFLRRRQQPLQMLLSIWSSCRRI